MHPTSVDAGLMRAAVADSGAAPSNLENPVQTYRLADSVVVRDERGLLGTSGCIVANPSRLNVPRYYDPAHSLLIGFLLRPRTLSEIGAFVADSAGLPMLTAPGVLSTVLQSMLQIGLLEATPSVGGPARRVCGPIGECRTRYAPAVSPVSVAMRLPMDSELLVRLLCECDRIGVLGVDLYGGAAALRSLAQAGEYGAESPIRCAVSARIKLDEFDAEAAESLETTTSRWGWAPVMILDVGPSGAHRIRSLAAPGVRFVVAYTIGIDDTEETLSRVVEDSLATGATFALLHVNDETVDSAASPVDTAGEKLECLRSLLGSYGSRVQVRVSNTPLPPRVGPSERGLLQLFGAYIGGCSNGLMVGNSAPQTIGCGGSMTTPQTIAQVGPLMPPNCCEAGMTRMAIDSDGTVYPCEESIGCPGLALGSVIESTIAEVWQSDGWEFFRGGWDLVDLQGCYDCRSYVMCSARRCRVFAAGSLGDRLAPMPACMRSHEALAMRAGKGRAE